MKPVITGTGLWLLFLFFLPACEKPKSIGADIIPSGDLLNVQHTDTLSVELETRFLDSIRTDEEPVNMFGNLIDADFGRIRTATFTNFRLAGSNLFFGDSLSLDSVVLKLELTGFYGDNTDPQDLEIFELDEKPLRENTYLNRDSLSCTTTNLVHASSQTLQFPANTPAKTISIRLSDAFGQKLLNASSDNLLNNDNFTNFLKGLYISTRPVAQTSREPGAVYYFKPDGAITGLYLYYNGKLGGIYSDTLSYRFQINEDAARFTRIIRSETSGRLISQVEQEVPGSDVYQLLQAGLPIEVKVRIPNYGNLFPVAVNKAELELPVLTEYFGSESRYQPPTIIQGIESNASGAPEGGAITSAIYDTENKVYTVALSSYSQRMINTPANNYGFFLSSLNSTTNLNRVVLAGMKHPTRKPRLKITYTSIPK